MSFKCDVSQFFNAGQAASAASDCRTQTASRGICDGQFLAALDIKAGTRPLAFVNPNDQWWKFFGQELAIFVPVAIYLVILGVRNMRQGVTKDYQTFSIWLPLVAGICTIVIPLTMTGAGALKIYSWTLENSLFVLSAAKAFAVAAFGWNVFTSYFATDHGVCPRGRLVDDPKDIANRLTGFDDTMKALPEEYRNQLADPTWSLVNRVAPVVAACFIALLTYIQSDLLDVQAASSDALCIFFAAIFFIGSGAIYGVAASKREVVASCFFFILAACLDIGGVAHMYNVASNLFWQTAFSSSDNHSVSTIGFWVVLGMSAGLVALAAVRMYSLYTVFSNERVQSALAAKEAELNRIQTQAQEEASRLVPSPTVVEMSTAGRPSVSTSSQYMYRPRA